MQTLLSQPAPPVTSDEEVRTDTAARRSLLLGGLHLLFANKRLLLWTWLASLLCGLLSTLPFLQRAGSYLNHSLAAQQLAGPVDISYLAELVHQSGNHNGLSPTPSLIAIAVFIFLNFVLAAGALFVFQSASLPRLSVVADAGLRYFWRFLRLTIVATVVIGLTVWLFSTLRDAYLAKAAETHLGRELFLRSSLSIAAIAIVWLLLRFYFDFAEAVVVQLGLAGDRRVRRSFVLAFRFLRGNFARAFFSYVLIAALGVALFALCAWIWVAAISPYSTAIAFLLGQLAIAFLLASRLWQRASLASLALQHAAALTQIPDVTLPTPASATPTVLEQRPIW